MLLHEFLEGSAARFPDKVALIWQQKRISYSHLDHSANRLANALLDFGLNRQDRAAVYLESSPEAVISIFGISRAGGVFLVINPQVKAKKAAYILNDCQVRFLITDTNHLKDISVILPSCSHLQTLIVTDLKAADAKFKEKAGLDIRSFSQVLTDFPASRPAQRCIDIDLASLIYTSGSTGIPKGVMLTHLNMVSAANSITEYLENTPDDIIIDVLPLSFDYGLYQVLMAFKFGGTVVLESSFLYLYKIIELIIKEKVTGFPIVPTVAALLFKLRNLEQYDFSNLRYITNTAQALPRKYISQLRKIFPQTKIFSMYGLTECKRVAYLPPEEIDRRPTSVGKAMPNTEAYIINPQGNEIKEPGTTGELVVRGANVMAGYWNLPEETEKVLKPGRIQGERVLHTGDLFQKDEEGYLYFISRKDDMIKVSGERVSPREVENALYEIEDIIEAAVLGVDDDILGQAIKAFVVLKKGSKLTGNDIIKLSAQRLENYMLPKFVEIRDELPKSAHGKMAKRGLE